MGIQKNSSQNATATILKVREVFEAIGLLCMMQVNGLSAVLKGLLGHVRGLGSAGSFGCGACPTFLIERACHRRIKGMTDLVQGLVRAFAP